MFELRVEHEVNAGEGSISDDGGDKAAAEAPDALGLVDLSKGHGNLLVVVFVRFKPGDLKWNLS